MSNISHEHIRRNDLRHLPCELIDDFQGLFIFIGPQIHILMTSYIQVNEFIY